MHPITWLALFSPLAASLPSPSAPASGTKFPWHHTEISNLDVACVRGKKQDPYTCTMKFDFYDPNSELVQEVNDAHCDVSWSWDGETTKRGPGNDHKEGFTVCSAAKSNIFQVQISRFTSASDWTIVVSHKYKDDVHFDAPLNAPNSFTQFEMPKLHPEKSVREDLGRFKYVMKEAIEAPVVGLA
ncbi:hypothetical protein B0T11DRAFT_130975 [Plectosphaerella cucumerina]|uniref:AA1-like domain-containing protein n=1 Tax=Plectosphaerella cucumerina TaxID=40658 RepID=A0A8K0T7K3_9PEZI|nr:hypothetical protein B0T11DRAFT_130975 [Plectosphaerella cucumerina]